MFSAGYRVRSQRILPFLVPVHSFLFVDVMGSGARRRLEVSGRFGAQAGDRNSEFAQSAHIVTDQALLLAFVGRRLIRFPGGGCPSRESGE